MPVVVLVVLSVLGYVTMGVLTASVCAYVDNRHEQKPMHSSDASLLAFFSVFWPMLVVVMTFTGMCVGVGKVASGYARFLKNLGVPKLP